MMLARSKYNKLKPQNCLMLKESRIIAPKFVLFFSLLLIIIGTRCVSNQQDWNIWQTWSQHTYVMQDTFYVANITCALFLCRHHSSTFPQDRKQTRFLFIISSICVTIRNVLMKEQGLQRLIWYLILFLCFLWAAVSCSQLDLNFTLCEAQVRGHRF